jgi:uncharacterized membrane protein
MVEPLKDIPKPPKKKLSFKQTLGKLLLEQNPATAFVNGLVTAGVLFYWASTKKSMPIFAWFGIMLLHSIFRTLYWRVRLERTDKELKTIENELQQLNKQMKQGKEYFENLKKNTENSPKNNS